MSSLIRYEMFVRSLFLLCFYLVVDLGLVPSFVSRWYLYHASLWLRKNVILLTLCKNLCKSDFNLINDPRKTKCPRIFYHFWIIYCVHVLRLLCLLFNSRRNFMFTTFMVPLLAHLYVQKYQNTISTTFDS